MSYALDGPELVAMRLMTAHALSATEFRVTAALLRHWNTEREDAFPSQRQLATQSKCADRTVRRAINSLQTKGVIAVTTVRTARGYQQNIHTFPVLSPADKVVLRDWIKACGQSCPQDRVVLRPKVTTGQVRPQDRSVLLTGIAIDRKIPKKKIRGGVLGIKGVSKFARENKTTLKPKTSGSSRFSISDLHADELMRKPMAAHPIAQKVQWFMSQPGNSPASLEQIIIGLKQAGFDLSSNEVTNELTSHRYVEGK